MTAFSYDPSAITELRDRFDDRLTTVASVLEQHGRDESSFPPVPPDAVVFPESTEEVVAIVDVCRRYGVPIIPFGAGTSLEGHIHATRGGISVDTSRMDKILDIDDQDLDVTIQPGVRRRQLKEALGKRGLFFSVDPGADASLGGMAATAASGTTTVRYGTMRENVLSLEVVLADGSVIRTGTKARKSAAGYDLTHLFIGSEGTLGIITELTLRVRGIPDSITAATCAFPDFRSAIEATTTIVQLGVPVARCEFLDAEAVSAVNAYSNSDHAELPTLFLEFHGTETSVADDVATVKEITESLGGSEFRWAGTLEERNKLWHARHEVLFALYQVRPGSRAVTTDVCVPVSRLADCLDETVADIATLPVPGMALGHVADGNFHCCLLIEQDDETERAAVKSFTDRLTVRAQSMGGTCTGEHGIGLGKRKALVHEAGEPAVAVMRSIKDALDPQGIMNPDKILVDPEGPDLSVA